MLIYFFFCRTSKNESYSNWSALLKPIKGTVLNLKRYFISIKLNPINLYTAQKFSYFFENPRYFRESYILIKENADEVRKNIKINSSKFLSNLGA